MGPDTVPVEHGVPEIEDDDDGDAVSVPAGVPVVVIESDGVVVTVGVVRVEGVELLLPG